MEMEELLINESIGNQEDLYELGIYYEDEDIKELLKECEVSSNE